MSAQERSSTADEFTSRLERRKVITHVGRAPPGLDLHALTGCAPEDMFGLLTNYRDLPRHITGLEEAEVLDEKDGTSSVRFSMKLPFPVGRITWTNLITAKRADDGYALEWSLLEGDLGVNEGWILLTRHRGQADVTYARYHVSIEAETRARKSAQRLVARWLLPRIVGHLRRVAEEM